MSFKILIIGSTGKLGISLIKFLNKNNIKVYAATCFKKKDKLLKLKYDYKIKKIFSLSSKDDKNKFFDLLKKKIDLVYFLDHGSSSLIYLNTILNYNSGSSIAIANKEMIIAGGKILFDKFKKTKNFFLALDSEHYSLKNNSLKNDIQKIYITASGGPFFFNKKISIDKVKLPEVLSHPKWKMGINNSIDSSNFINKVLEIYELSYIYDIPLNKIDFLVSKEAFIHSIILYKDGIISLNTFKNNMLITLINPLRKFFKINNDINSEKFLFNNSNFKLDKKFDPRFIFFNYYKIMKKFEHHNQIKLMIINNYAHSLYLEKKIEYKDIIPFIIKRIKSFKDNPKFKNLLEIVEYIDKIKLKIYD